MLTDLVEPALSQEDKETLATINALYPSKKESMSDGQGSDTLAYSHGMQPFKADYSVRGACGSKGLS